MLLSLPPLRCLFQNMGAPVLVILAIAVLAALTSAATDCGQQPSACLSDPQHGQCVRDSRTQRCRPRLCGDIIHPPTCHATPGCEYLAALWVCIELGTTEAPDDTSSPSQSAQTANPTANETRETPNLNKYPDGQPLNGITTPTANPTTSPAANPAALPPTTDLCLTQRCSRDCTGRVGVRSGISTWDDRDDHAEELELDAGEDDDSSGGGGGGGTASAACDNLVDDHGFPLAEAAICQWLVSSDPGDCNQTGLSSVCSRSCCRLMHGLRVDDRTSNSELGQPPVYFSCGWDSDLQLCRAGEITSTLEYNALDESSPGDCSHHSPSLTVSPTMFPAVPASNPTANPTTSPAANPAALPPTTDLCLTQRCSRDCTGRVGVRSGISTWDDRDDHAEELELDAGEDDDSSGGGGGGGTASAACDNLVDDHGFPLAEAAICQWLVSSDPGDCNQTGLSSVCSRSCCRLMHGLRVDDRTSNSELGQPPVYFSCGWDSDLQLCRAGEITSTLEYNALDESSPGDCSHHSPSLTVSPTMFPAVPTSNPTANPTTSPAANPTTLDPTTLDPTTLDPTTLDPTTLDPCRNGATCIRMMVNTEGSDDGSGDGNVADITKVAEFRCIFADGFLGDTCDQADSALSTTRGSTSGSPSALDGISGDGSGDGDDDETGIADAARTDSRQPAHAKADTSAGTQSFRAAVAIGAIAVAAIVMTTVLRRRKRHAGVDLEWFDDIARSRSGQLLSVGDSHPIPI